MDDCRSWNHARGDAGAQEYVPHRSCYTLRLIHLEEGEPEPDGLQLWIDLPKQYKMMVSLHYPPLSSALPLTLYSCRNPTTKN